MKEININIEGYNVNGICVACLNYNRSMFYHKDVKECFKLLGNIDVPDGLTVQVCWECLARMKSVLEFRLQILRSYDCLIKYSRKHTFLDSPKDLSFNAVQRLSVLTCESFSMGHVPQVKDELPVEEIKEETCDEDTKLEIEVTGDEEDLNEIVAKTEEELQYQYNAVLSDGVATPLQDGGASSDEDIRLSALKTAKREKRGRRKSGGRKEALSEAASESKPRSKRGRSRSLPADLAAQCTLTEEEMWRVRALDAVCGAFVALRHRCARCLLAFQTRRQADCHNKGRHSQKSETSVQCDVCQSYFLSKETLATHRNHHLSAYRCCKCDYVTSMKRIMQAHLTEEHGASKLHRCSECQAEFSTKSKLNYHKVQCSRERPQCDCCGKVFANKMTLRHHLKQSQAPESQSAKPKLFIPCKGCDKVFFTRKSYRAHVVVHDGLTYPCPVCGKLFRWKRNLSRHTRNHRERAAGAAHRCRECGKSFASRDCYNNHVRLSKRHAGEANYAHACQYCGKKFPTKWCMVDHVDWEHLKRIKYQCSVCFKAFKTAKIMVAHMNNIHEGKSKKEPDGEHLCDVCGKSYKTVKRLKGHVWAMHTNRSVNKSHRCPLCPATFIWQTSIYKHMKMMHDDTKRKQPRAAAKKSEPYPDMELANRMQYFQQNIAANLVQSMAAQ